MMSVRDFFRQRWRIVALAVLLVVFLFMKLSLLPLPHAVGWDEAVYLGMGKYLYSGGSMGLWEDIRPIGLPLVLGTVLQFLTSSITAAELISLLFAIGLMILVFLVGKKEGALAVSLLAVTPLFFSSSTEIMSSIPAAFFSLLALYLYLENKHPFFVGLSGGIAFLFRFPHGLTLLALIVLIHSRKVVWLLGGFIVVLLPFLIFNHVNYADLSGSAMDAAFRPLIFAARHQANPFHVASAFFYGKQLLFQYLLLAFALPGMFLRRARPFVLMTGAYFVYYTLIPNKQERFLLDFLPYVSVLAALGLAHVHKVLRFSAVARMGFLLFCVVATVPVVLSDYQSLRSYDDELVPFLSTLPQGTMLTMTPLPAAYSNDLFIPMYDNPTVALETYHAWKDKVEYVLYFSDYYPCDNVACTEKNEELERLLNKYPIVVEKRIGWQEYILYKVT